MRVGRFRPEVLAAVSQAPSVKRQVRAVAAEIRKEARRRAPKDSGNLAKNIAVENVYDRATGLVEYRVGWTKQGFYGSLVELGTEDTPARPHLRPAADKFRSAG
jgi:HK97 gp10 family phage protein